MVENMQQIMIKQPKAVPVENFRQYFQEMKITSLCATYPKNYFEEDKTDLLIIK